MSPVVMVFFSYVAVGIVALFCAVCLGIFIAGWRRKSRFLLWSGGIPLVLCLMGVSFLIFQDSIIPLETQGRALMHLPAEAKVVNVENGEWSGDGVVYFKLPPTRSKGDWLDAVWKMNLPPTWRTEVPPEAAAFHEIHNGENRKSLFRDGDRREIECDSATQLYRYQVELDS